MLEMSMSRLIQNFALVIFLLSPTWSLSETKYNQTELKLDIASSYKISGHQYTRIEPIADAKSHYKEILEKLQEKHYKRLKINDALSKLYLEAYIESLDPQKSYFLESDIVEFNQWRNLLDDFLLDSEVSPGYAMYNRFLLRAEDQLLKNLTLTLTLSPRPHLVDVHC